MKKLVLSLLFISHSSIIVSQEIRSQTWLEQHNKGSYHEGVYSMEVSNPAMKLISLTTQWEPYSFGEGKVQKIQFAAPEGSPYLIKAEELIINEFYWFQSQTGETESTGLVTFEGWAVDPLLGQLKLDDRSLGLLVRLGGFQDRTFTPAAVYHSEPTLSPTHIYAKLRLGINIEGGVWELFSSSEVREEYSVLKKRILPTSGGYFITLPILFSELSDKVKWYTVKVIVIEEENTDRMTYSFKIYNPAYSSN